MRTFVLAAVFASALTASAIAQTYDPSIPPRDPAFGKGNADNDTFHRPSEADLTFATHPAASWHKRMANPKLH